MPRVEGVGMTNFSDWSIHSLSEEDNLFVSTVQALVLNHNFFFSIL